MGDPRGLKSSGGVFAEEFGQIGNRADGSVVSWEFGDDG